MDSFYNKDFWENFKKNIPSASRFPSQNNSIPLKQAVGLVKEQDDNDKKILKEFSENEGIKRKLKPKILLWVCMLALIQIVFMNFILLIVTLGTVANEDGIWFINQISESALPSIFSFLKFYVSATVAELLGMLLIMVSNVFNNAITDIFKINKQQNSKEK